MNNPRLLALSFFLILILPSCSSKQINEESPYAIQLKEVRSYYKALDIQERLEEYGVESYILSEETNDGNWYRVLSGAEKSIDDIKNHRKELESLTSMTDFEIINFQKIEDNLVLDFEDNLSERKRLKSKKPNIPEKIYNLVNKFPEDKNFIIKSFFVTNSPDSINEIRKFKASYDNIKHDLPRGIYMKSLMKKSNAIAEVIYEDKLFGDRVTLDIIQLKEGLDLGLTENTNIGSKEIANYFAELILETGNYVFEDKLKIKVSSFQKLSGYKVTIQPKRNKEDLRKYFCLVSKDSRFLVFSQSTDKTDEEIIDIIEELGESDGLASYDEFYNAFYALPTTCNINDEFISIYCEKLTWSYARSRGYAKWAKKIVGHWRTIANFSGEENNNWSVSFFDLLNNSNVDLVYNNLYINDRKSSRNSDIIDVLNKQGVVFTGKYPTELSFPGNRFVVSINNGNRGRLTRDKKLTIAGCLQIQ